MASESTRFTALCVISLASIFYLLSPAHGAFSSQLEGKSHGHSLKGVFRSKRQSVCIDGTYQHEGKTCCLCGAGQFLEKHCSSSESPDDRECQPCESGTYRSTPNYEMTCEVCTSCDQINENKEVAERCTPAKNTKCKCKKGHYCETEICVVCHPCKQCGGEGIKVDCTATNNTVCGDKTEERNLPLPIGVSVAIITIIIVALIVYIWWKRRRTRHNLNQTPGAPTEEQSLIELQTHHMPDIAEVLGWKDMKDVARRSCMLDTTIEFCVENHPRDVREQTLQLLQIWVEKEGRNASSNLIQILEQSGKRRKAEKVRGILSSGSAAAPNASV